MKCRNCRHLYKDWCAHKLDSPDPDLDRECKDYMQATHADRIRSMSDEELAEFLEDLDSCYSYCPQGTARSPYTLDCSQTCEKYLLSWLQQPAEEDT